MNNIDLTLIYNEIDFVNRFKILSTNHNNFSERLNGNKKELYDKILSKYDYKIKYFKKENFYKIEENTDGVLFIIQLVLKDGIIEPMLYIKIGDKYLEPDHRFDSICEKLDSSFSRKDFPIPKYSSEIELKEILDEIFSIYEDFKKEILKTL
ncbi:hypothetical protein [Empedobacter tilapiae]|uniref:Uncharacterized protein n=1 Tax=Empedobacter tilapiae TaxID=2491114 RepID=A0A4Z1B6P0_9FLAO|nr:hypothetical protein [Empedobacter tilapiae]TGN26078.1 hypothetical protein E4J94_12035 [Empedobacter tilapiae]